MISYLVLLLVPFVYSQLKIIQCPDSNDWFFHANGIARRLKEERTAALLHPEYQKNFYSKGGNYCDRIGHNISTIIGRCNGDSTNSVYFFTNYVGKNFRLGNGVWTMIPYNGRRIFKRLLYASTSKSNPHDDILNSWGFYKDSEVRSLPCKWTGTIPPAGKLPTMYTVDTVSSQRITAFPTGRILFCIDKNLFYRVMDEKNTVAILTRENYTSFIMNSGSFESYDEIRNLASNPGCAFTSTGTRVDPNCPLTSDIQIIQNCAQHFGNSCPSNQPPKDFFTCANDRIPRVFTLDPVSKALVVVSDSLVPKDTEKIQVVHDCTCLSGYSPCSYSGIVDGNTYTCKGDSFQTVYSLSLSNYALDSITNEQVTIPSSSLDCNCFKGSWNQNRIAKFSTETTTLPVHDQFYTCINDDSVPKKLWQYTEGDLILENTPSPQDPDLLKSWNEFVTNSPTLQDCSVFPNFMRQLGYSIAAQSGTVQSTYPLSLVSSDGSCFDRCSSTVLNLGNNCHESNDLSNPDFKKSIFDNKSPKLLCLAEIVFRCTNYGSSKFSWPSMSCASWFRRALSDSIENPFRTIYSKCSKWEYGSRTINITACNEARAAYIAANKCVEAVGRNSNCDYAKLLHTILTSDEVDIQVVLPASMVPLNQ